MLKYTMMMNTIKAIVLTILLSFISLALCAQSSGAFSYQAVIRNSDGDLIVNENVDIRVSILQGSADGIQVYSEIINAITNSTGLISIQVGSVANFDAIDWSDGNYFIKTETDLEGEGNYSIVSVNQLLSVPFALFAKSAQEVSDSYEESDPEFNQWDKSTGIAITESQISDLKEYIVEEADPQFTAWDKSTGIEISENQITDLQSYLLQESDPFYSTTFDVVNPQDGNWLMYNSASQQWQVSNIEYATEIHSHSLASNEIDGFMSATDKVKLDGIAVGAQVNVNADWNATSGDAKIQNKPTAITSFLLDADGQRITRVADPVNAQDAVTKYYVDELYDRIDELQVYSGMKAYDADGNEYATVTIGEQIWMTENLKTTKFADKSSIPLVTSNSEWITTLTPAYTWYNNDQDTYGNTYGALYNWYAVNTGKLCPSGWHVPDNDDWSQLISNLGGEVVAGGKLKEAGYDHWNTPNTSGTNSSGFTALPGGYRYFDTGEFWYIRTIGIFWSSSFQSDIAYYYYLRHDNMNIYQDQDSKKGGFSVRCVKD